MSIVGIVVNPWAGKDVRRLHAPVGHTPDTAKVGIVRRVASAALESGADRVVVAGDTGRIGERAINDLPGAELLDGPGTGSALDTRRAAAQFAELGCSVIVALGGDGTCRDVALGWRDAPMIAVSTGTNNVFPMMIDATSVGTAAGLVASRAIALRAASRQAKVLDVSIDADGTTTQDLALVDVALIDAAHTGARAVVKADSIRAVVAAIASPASTGLSSIAGRLQPLRRDEPGAIVVRLDGQGGRRLRAPIMPGHFDTVTVASVEHVEDGRPVRIEGPGVLAFDGERDRILGDGATGTVTVRRDGPSVIDVRQTLVCAARVALFDDLEADDGR